MKFSSVAVLAGVAAAAPTAELQKRANIDSTILNYALTLEHLEAAFYNWGIITYSAKDFADAGYTQTNAYRNFIEVRNDEDTHVSVLTAAIKSAGYKPVAKCSYNFSVTSVQSFIQTASLLEGVGVTAYLGAANLITNPAYVTVAGSILTVEARHNAYIRSLLTQSPFAQPFDVPLDFDQVYSLASGFITGCPSTNPPLPVKAFPTLTYAGASPIAQGSKITLMAAPGTKIPAKSYVAFILTTGTIYQPATVYGDKVEVTIPASSLGPAGQSYAILTTSGSAVGDANTIAGPAVIPILAPYLA